MALSLLGYKHNFLRTVLGNLRVAGVTDTIGATDEGLEGNVGDQLTQGALKTTNSVPILIEKQHKTRTRRSQGSSYKKRMATSNVAPPQHSILYAFASA